MKKVLINVCYGGFGQVSKQFADRFFELTGRQIKKGYDEDSYDLYDCINYSNELYFSDERVRENPIVIRIAEELGVEAISASCSSYNIEIVPDDFDYYISEYDGVEEIELVPILNIDKLISLSTNRDELKKYLDDMNVRHSE